MFIGVPWYILLKKTKEFNVELDVTVNKLLKDVLVLITRRT